MSEALNTRFQTERISQAAWSRVAVSRAIGTAVFYSLLIVIALAAIPYGAAEPWWKASADATIFGLVLFAVIADLFDPPAARSRGSGLVLPLLALILFAFLQTISWTGRSGTLSADVFETRRFIVHLCALIAAGWLLVRHTNSERRVRHLVETIILIALASAAFGLWRQSSQSSVGFFLPSLRPAFGYGQFINANHFAFLMEMALGLALGIVTCRGAKGARLFIYLGAAVPMWVALVLANSRGGLISILCQSALLAALLVWERVGKANPERRFSGAGRIALQLLLAATLLIGAATILVLVGGDPLAQRIDSISVELDSKTAESYTLRQNIWQATWGLIREHPVAGVGFGGYWIGITKYHRASGEATPQQAHNDYLELLASGGLIGLGLGVWFLAAFARAAYQRVRETKGFLRAVTLGALVGILTVAIHSMVDFGLHIPVNALVCTALFALVVADPAGNRNQAQAKVVNGGSQGQRPQAAPRLD
jgi:O-antigen ligase